MAKLIGAQPMVLQAILGAQGDSLDYIEDSRIAKTTGIALEDVRNWLQTLESEDLIEVARTEAGLSALINPMGRLSLGQFRPFLTPMPDRLSALPQTTSDSPPQRENSDSHSVPRDPSVPGKVSIRCCHSHKTALIICLKDPDTRAHWACLLGDPLFEQKRAEMTGLDEFQVRYFQTLEQAEIALHDLFQEDPGARCILLSDTLLEADDAWRPEWAATSALKALRDEFALHPYVSVAVSLHPERIPDNDLILPPNCSLKDWISGLQLLVDRLNYYCTPLERERPAGLDVRPIRTQGELLEAFKLRYRVYRVMGYLEQEYIDTAYQIELHWCDTISVHFGAFVPNPPSAPKLVATARLILTRDEDPTVAEWTRTIARSCHQLATLNTQQIELAQFRLPVFHTLRLNEEMREAAISPYPWAELSRVVVAPAWRGCGLSRDLIKRAIDRADQMNVERILLECLETHKDMYERVGFTSLGQRGEVMGIGKTMIGMQRRRPQVAPAARI